MNAKGPRPRTISPITKGCFIVLAALGLLYVAFGLVFGTWVLVTHNRAEHASQLCRDHMQSLSNAMMAYLADYDDTFPPADAWSDRLAPYIRDADPFVCPSAPQGRCSYAFSAKLGGLRASSIQDQRATVLLFESDRGWNAAGAAELLPDRPRHGSGDRYVLANGREYWLERKRTLDKHGRTLYWTKQLLVGPQIRWEPAVR